MTDGGAEGNRTPDLIIANDALYQLSYSPASVVRAISRAVRALQWSCVERGLNPFFGAHMLALPAFPPHILAMRIKFLSLMLPIMLGLAGCASTPKGQPPAPPLAVAAAAMPATSSVKGWEDASLSTGSWVYLVDQQGPVALFGVAGAPAQFALRCDLARRIVLAQRRVDPPLEPEAAMTITTSTTERSFSIASFAGATHYLAAEIPAQNAMLDAMAFSRARFAISIPGQPMLILPSWVEVTRVVEDCRP